MEAGTFRRTVGTPCRYADVQILLCVGDAAVAGNAP